MTDTPENTSQEERAERPADETEAMAEVVEETPSEAEVPSPECDAVEDENEGQVEDEDEDEEEDDGALAIPLDQQQQVLEALLFAADQPLPAPRLAQAMGRRVDARRVRSLIGRLNDLYQRQNRAFEIVEIAGGFQMLTRPEFHKRVAELHKHRRQDKLSQSAVETLAIVAYRQPVLRAQIDDIRGVQTGPLLRSLLERGLIKIVGRQNVPGRPILYGTSRLFLNHYGLKSLRDLPKVKEHAPP